MQTEVIRLDTFDLSFAGEVVRSIGLSGGLDSETLLMLQREAVQ